MAGGDDHALCALGATAWVPAQAGPHPHVQRNRRDGALRCPAFDFGVQSVYHFSRRKLFGREARVGKASAKVTHPVMRYEFRRR